MTVMTPIKVQPERAPELARVPPRLLDYTVAVNAGEKLARPCRKDFGSNF
eukprot:CAMPEP_0170452430 /NCGR_PEP_ID=MMETSP0123-20130129/1328_1 /TAXON_ID=182087 /ORGANISM="Favella ehrenbergii, Strain Fehren 1" /LENGTH=49 /DNA_ID=CAMNT_0010714427 /DNA_START=41 /DNA_END=190 /DNA_ORIENTATION=+